MASATSGGRAAAFGSVAVIFWLICAATPACWGLPPKATEDDVLKMLIETEPDMMHESPEVLLEGWRSNFTWNDRRLLVFARGGPGAWDWPSLEEWDLNYKFLSNAIDPLLGFGVIELDHPPEEGEVMVIFEALREADVFQEVLLDYVTDPVQFTRGGAGPAAPAADDDEPAAADQQPPQDPPAALDAFPASSDMNITQLISRFASVLGIVPDDPSWDSLYNVQKVGGSLTLELGARGQDVIIAIVDSGCNIGHPDLAANLWANDAELDGVPGVDDDGNGFVDDIHGWNFVDDSPDVSDGNGHGSHVAGTAGAVINNQIGIAGIAPAAKIMCLKFMGEDGTGFQSDAIQAIAYAVQMKAHIQNHSWGSTSTSLGLLQAAEMARDFGQLLVAAAGNDNVNTDDPATFNFPSGLSSPVLSPTTAGNVLSVAASDEDDNKASFSNFGNHTVDMAAPGVGIVSLSNSGDGVTMKSGTSMASPLVAGAAAVVLSVSAARNDPAVFTAAGINPEALKKILMLSLDTVASLEGVAGTSGRLNVFSAVQLAAAGNVSEIVPPSPEAQTAKDSTEWTVVLTVATAMAAVACLGIVGAVCCCSTANRRPSSPKAEPNTA